MKSLIYVTAFVPTWVFLTVLIAIMASGGKLYSGALRRGE